MEAFIVSRRIFSPMQARAAAAAVYTRLGGTPYARAAAQNTYDRVLNTKHAFLVVTAPGTGLADGQIEGIYSYGPENANRSALTPFGNTVRQGAGTDTFEDDIAALRSIENGSAGADISFSEIVGLSNEDAHFLFGVESDARPYNPVPASTPGSTNSNSEAFARGRAGSAAAGTRFVPPSGIHPGAGQSDRVTCTGSRIRRESC